MPLKHERRPADGVMVWLAEDLTAATPQEKVALLIAMSAMRSSEGSATLIEGKEGWTSSTNSDEMNLAAYAGLAEAVFGVYRGWAELEPEQRPLPFMIRLQGQDLPFTLDVAWRPSRCATITCPRRQPGRG